MKVTVNKKDTKKIKTFPWLGISNTDLNLILLFTSGGDAIIINSIDTYDIGRCVSWNHLDYSEFQGEIVLSNSCD